MRANGTAIQGHYRTSPDYTVNNNFTTVGNVNPYTGKAGTLPRDNDYITNYSPVQTTYYSSPSTNISSYVKDVTTPLNGGYNVSRIVEQVLEEGKWKTSKEDLASSYLYFDRNAFYFKRGQNSWKVRDKVFIECNSNAKVCVYNSEYGVTVLDEYQKFILFYDANDKTKRYFYLIGNPNYSVSPNY